MVDDGLLDADVAWVVELAPEVVVVELDDELPQAARARPEAARATMVQVRTRLMWGRSFPFDPVAATDVTDPIRSADGSRRRAWKAVARPGGHRPWAGPGPEPTACPAPDTPSCDHRHMLLDRLAQVTDQLRNSVAGLDPERLSGPDAARLLDAFAEIERLASAGTLLAARRVESSNVWRRSGHRSAAAHLAEATGTGIGPAITALETARRLGSLPATDEAARRGLLSETQVKEIAGAAIIRPEAEQSLIDAAGQQPLSVLKLRCRRVRATGQDARSAYDAIRRTRYLRNWVEDGGAVRFDARLTPDDGARLLAAVAAEADRLMVSAKRAGLDEPRKALLADALVGLAAGGRDHHRSASDPGDADPRAAGSPEVTGTRDAHVPTAVVHVRVDHAALVRGQVEGDELCELVGIGPVPVDVARRLAVDSILHVLVTDGVDVTTVAHSGRTIPAALRRALVERDPECVVPGCDTHESLEIDHILPFAEGGVASLDNLARLCHWHHYLKTHRGHRLEHLPRTDVPGTPAGRWRWITPEEPPPVPRHIRLSG